MCTAITSIPQVASYRSIEPLVTSAQSSSLGPEVIPVLGRWYSYELMVKANTPGQRDGRIAMWLDGKLIADFPNLRLRETSALKIDRFGLDSARWTATPWASPRNGTTT